MNHKTSDQPDPKVESAQTSKTDFDRNYGGVYGGLPEARQDDAPGPAPVSPNPAEPSEDAG